MSAISGVSEVPFVLDDQQATKLFAHLSDPDQNREEFDRLEQFDSRDLSAEIGLTMPEGYELRIIEHFNEHTELEIFVLNRAEKRVAFFNRVEKTDITLDRINPNKPVKQSMIWRQIRGDDAKATRDITEAVFFKKLVQEYNIVVSDSEQTRDGKRMWESLLYTAMKNPKFVAAVGDAKNGNVSFIRDEKSLATQEKWLWGQCEFHRDRLGVIATAA